MKQVYGSYSQARESVQSVVLPAGAPAQQLSFSVTLDAPLTGSVTEIVKAG